MNSGSFIQIRVCEESEGTPIWSGHVPSCIGEDFIIMPDMPSLVVLNVWLFQYTTIWLFMQSVHVNLTLLLLVAAVRRAIASLGLSHHNVLALQSVSHQHH